MPSTLIITLLYVHHAGVYLETVSQSSEQHIFLIIPLQPPRHSREVITLSPRQRHSIKIMEIAIFLQATTHFLPLWCHNSVQDGHTSRNCLQNNYCLLATLHNLPSKLFYKLGVLFQRCWKRDRKETIKTLFIFGQTQFKFQFSQIFGRLTYLLYLSAKFTQSYWTLTTA